MAYLLLEPIYRSALLQHERQLCVPGLDQRPIRNLGSLDQPWPQRLRYPVHVQGFPSPIWEDEFAPQFHAVSLTSTAPREHVAAFGRNGNLSCSWASSLRDESSFV